MQVDDPAAGAQGLAVGRAQHRAATGRQDHAILLADLLDHRLFAITEALLTLDVEDPRNIRPGTLFDFLIGVLEGKTQFFGKQTPDGAFSCPHRADQNQISHRYQRLTAMAWLFMMRGVRNTSSSDFLS
ncbi:hypothetical protein D3C80_447790 [compost metagenome]